MTVKVGLIGTGTVGGGCIDILRNHKEDFCATMASILSWRAYARVILNRRRRTVSPICSRPTF